MLSDLEIEARKDRVTGSTERFWSKVRKTEECWVWTSSKHGHGYGLFFLNGKTERAHRLSYKIQFGEIPKGMQVCHHCDNTSCVRPDHLFLGTAKQNMEDASRKGRLPIGENAARSKLTAPKVGEIRARHASGNNPIAKLAREYGVSRPTIDAVLNRKTWAHL